MKSEKGIPGDIRRTTYIREVPATSGEFPRMRAVFPGDASERRSGGKEKIQRRASPSAVTIIETPKSFVLEGRPAKEGSLAHSGKWGLFGGHVEKDEDPSRTLPRELDEELNTPSQRLGAIEPLWSGDYHGSQNRAGEPVTRHVSLFHVNLSSTEGVTMKVQGEIVEIPKTPAALEEHKEKLTNFAYDALKERLRVQSAAESTPFTIES